MLSKWGDALSWTVEQKAKMFDEIAKHYYQRNFGSFSKSDIDLLMFHFFLEKEINKNTNNNGLLNYNSVSDYKISKELGITQQRVKSLKIKKQLIYPIEYSWQESLAALLKNARFDRETQKIILTIPDPNLLIEIQNYVEEQGGYIATQFNSKLLQIRVEYFIELVILVEGSVTSKNKIIKALKESIAESNKNESIFDEKNIGKSLLEAGVNITTIVANLTSIASGDNILAKSIAGLIQR